jgi:PD-(D/E)XK nuclease superfamily protein
MRYTRERMFCAMRERLINRRRQGDLGEASAIEWLTSKGALVWTPLGHSPDVDLIAEVDGHLLRIQVKTTTHEWRGGAGERRWCASVVTNGGNQSWTGVAKRFDPEKVDYLFVLVGDGRRWLIPAADVEATTTVRLGGRKYSESEIEPGASIVEAVYGSQVRASKLDAHRWGSAGVGEPGRTVNPMA